MAKRFEEQYRAVRGMIRSRENTGAYLRKLDRVYRQTREAWANF